MDVDREGRTQLHYAALSGDMEAAREAFAQGADIALADHRGYTPLHFAAQTSAPTLVAYLLDNGAPIDAEDAHGNTPLWTATFNDKTGECVRHLLSAGADPDHPNKAGTTPRKLAETIANSAALRWYSG
jgi:uncharacterized protein